MSATLELFLKEYANAWSSRLECLLAALDADAIVSRILALAGREAYDGLFERDSLGRGILVHEMLADPAWIEARQWIDREFSAIAEGADELREEAYICAAALLTGRLNAETPEGFRIEVEIPVEERKTLRDQTIGSLRLDERIRAVAKQLIADLENDLYWAYMGSDPPPGEANRRIREQTFKRVESARRNLRRLVGDYCFLAARSLNRAFLDAWADVIAAEPDVSETSSTENETDVEDIPSR